MCRVLMELEIPASVEEIGDGCFSDCTSLSRVTFASGSALRRIGKEAFCGCDELREVEIPASVEEIGEGCFGIGECASDSCGVSLSRVTFGKGSVLKTIGSYAFQYCQNLREIEIPAGVQEIGSGAFLKCNISHISFSGESETKDDRSAHDTEGPEE